jgi:hypothetical protein
VAPNNKRWVAQGPHVLEFSVQPKLELQRRYSSTALLPASAQPVREPEGLAVRKGMLYTAWAQHEGTCVSATPLEVLAQAAAPVNCHQLATKEQLEMPCSGTGRRQTWCCMPEGESWVLWGGRLGPDGAFYITANPGVGACHWLQTAHCRWLVVDVA